MSYTREQLECMVSKQRLVERFLEMIAIHAPAKQEKPFAEYMIAEFETLGAEIYLDKGYEQYGGNASTIFARIPGTVPGKAIAISIHMDVVEPNKGVAPIIDGDFIRADGTTTLGGDDRGGCAAVMEALKTLKEQQIDHQDIFVVVTPCEEVGLLGAKYIDWERVPEGLMPPKNMIVVDNAGRAGLVAHTGPAMYHYTISFKGRKAHAGIEPEKGINAIQLASHAISRMQIGRLDSLTTSNLGTICTEGAINVVPDSCVVVGELREHSEERLQEVLASYKAACDEAVALMGGSYSFEEKLDFPALKPKDDLVFACEFAALYDAIGVKGELQVIGGGSDCNIFAAEGFNSVIIGFGLYDAHTLQENLNTEDMYLTTLALVKYIAEKR